MNIAFIGLGTMGGAMSANLIKGGFSVYGFDISSAALERLEEAGGTPCAGMAEAAARADIVFTMLPNSPHVEQAVRAAVDGAAGGTLFVDCSTILPDATIRVGEFLASKGMRFMDAPVGRTGREARLGKLLFMVGGEERDMEYVRPCLECMGDTILHCGPVGSGIATKIINNYMSITLNVLTAEALTLGESLGLDRGRLMEALSGTPAGRGHLATTYPNKVFRDDISAAFMLDLANKDLGLAIEVANMKNVPLFTGGAARQAYSLARARGYGGKDWTAMLNVLRELAQVQPPSRREEGV